MLMAVLIVLGVYLLACYAYGVYLLVKVVRDRRRLAKAGESMPAPLPHPYPAAPTRKAA